MKKCERCRQDQDGNNRICKHCEYILLARIEKFKELGVSVEATKNELKMWGIEEVKHGNCRYSSTH